MGRVKGQDSWGFECQWGWGWVLGSENGGWPSVGNVRILHVELFHFCEMEGVRGERESSAAWLYCLLDYHSSLSIIILLPFTQDYVRKCRFLLSTHNHLLVDERGELQLANTMSSSLLLHYRNPLSWDPDFNSIHIRHYQNPGLPFFLDQDQQEGKTIAFLLFFDGKRAVTWNESHWVQHVLFCRW